MGLDMYMMKKLWVGEEFEHRNTKSNVVITIEEKEFKVEDKISEISIQQAYWRKANAVHKWFVDNVQDGEDDCKSYPVDISDFRRLKELCEKTLESKTAEFLPPEKGFFFGSQEVDEYYFEDVEYTLKVCEECIRILEQEDNPLSVSFVYNSSW